MAKIAVVFHSAQGHTKNLAEAILRGAHNAGGDPSLLSVEDLGKDAPGWATLDGADAIIFGCPTYMGGYSAQFKAFIDAASSRWFTQAWKDKFAAGFTNSGSYSGDKLGTLQALWINAMQHGMIWISLGLMPPFSDQPEGPHGAQEINRVGAFGGAMSQSSNKLGADVTPTPGDLKTGELLGERVATLTAKYFGR